ncbi:MAG: Nif3-like dinuclear metal center hexameric protein [Clostridia bacterium]|nr:Nif3-like dinuclear metal center hexameric protein [Clostridia bacterium]
MILRGDYDNSGIIVKCTDKVEKVLFSLDLSKKVVEYAIENACDTIVTHHPAIYNPIKSLSVDDGSAPVTLAVMNGLNVISMHLNLDMADKGIDYYLSIALGGENHKIIDYLDATYGYGREFNVSVSLSDFVDKIKDKLGTDKIITYGTGKVNKVASFCGGGASYALDFINNKKTDADTIVTSDVPHHVIKELVENGKKLVIIPHYASEDYGFNKFYSFVEKETNGQIQTLYFEDRRFK